MAKWVGQMLSHAMSLIFMPCRASTSTAQPPSSQSSESASALRHVVNTNTSVTEEYPVPPAEGGGRLLDGTFNEDDSHASFAEAVASWRKTSTSETADVLPRKTWTQASSHVAASSDVQTASSPTSSVCLVMISVSGPDRLTCYVAENKR